MSFQILSDTEPVARKERKCIWCGEQINIGEKHHLQTGKMYGDIQANRYHEECWVAALEMWKASPDDGFDAFSFKRGSTEGK